jgi:hypothetical protein
MGQDWPSPHHHEPHPLPRIEDLPAAWEGYDRERVQAAFDAFYRHIAQLDATLRALESVDVFREQAGDLRIELRSLRAAGWAPYPRGYAFTPERSMLGSVPSAVGRIALEVVFLVIVAAVVAVAKFSALEIVGVMAGAVLITFLVELIAARDRRGATPIPATAPMARSAPAPAAPEAVEKPAVAAVEHAPAVTDEDDQPTTGELSIALVQREEEEPEEDPAEEVLGWAAFAEPAGQPLTLMGALAEEVPPVGSEDEPSEERDETADVQSAETKPEPEEVPERAPVPEPEPTPEPAAELQPEPEPEEAPKPEAEPDPEPDLEPVADVTERETGTIARRARFRRRRPEGPPPEPTPAPAPKHVRVLPPPETGVGAAELPPWERGFDETDERRR